MPGAILFSGLTCCGSSGGAEKGGGGRGAGGGEGGRPPGSVWDAGVCAQDNDGAVKKTARKTRERNGFFIVIIANAAM